jgi:plasmid maintenance system killer protein
MFNPKNLIIAFLFYFGLFYGGTAFSTENEVPIHEVFRQSCAVRFIQEQAKLPSLTAEFGPIDDTILTSLSKNENFELVFRAYWFLQNAPKEFFRQLADILSRPYVNLTFADWANDTGMDGTKLRKGFLGKVLNDVIVGSNPKSEEELNFLYILVEALYTLPHASVAAAKKGQQADEDRINAFVRSNARDPNFRKVLGDAVPEIAIRYMNVRKPGHLFQLNALSAPSSEDRKRDMRQKIRENLIRKGVAGDQARLWVSSFLIIQIRALAKILHEKFVTPFTVENKLAPVDALDQAFDELYESEFRHFRNRSELRRLLYHAVQVGLSTINAYDVPKWTLKGLQLELISIFTETMQTLIEDEIIRTTPVESASDRIASDTPDSRFARVEFTGFRRPEHNQSSVRGLISRARKKREIAHRVEQLEFESARAVPTGEFVSGASGILSFKDRRLADFFESVEPTDPQIYKQSGHFPWSKIARQILVELNRLDRCRTLGEVKNQFDILKRYSHNREQAGRYGLNVNKRWRILFTWDGTPGPTYVEVADYHGE